MADGTDIDQARRKAIVEAALMAADEPLDFRRLQALFDEAEQPDTLALQQILDSLAEEYAERGVELRRVASGFRFQVREELTPWVSRLWEERPGRYSRAMLETLALIAYRQPVTRGEIEEVRGVSVNTSIMRSLQERGWIRVVGHRDVPGRPALYGTTKAFLDYFNLQSLEQLPALSELRDYDNINVELELGLPGPDQAGAGESSGRSGPSGEA